MRGRRAITIEDVLRGPTRLGDLAATLRKMRGEMPAAGYTAGVLVGLTVVEVGLQLALAVSGKTLLDGVLRDRGLSWGLGAGAFGLIGLVLVASWSRQVWQERASLRWRERCVDRLGTHITAARLEDLSAVPMAALREILMTDAPYLTRFGIETLTQSCVLGLWVLAAAGFLALYASPLLIVLVALLAICGGAMLWGSRAHLGLTGRRFAALAELSQSARNLVEVDRVMLTRQFGLGPRFLDHFNAAHDAFRAIALKQGRLTAAVRAMLGVLNAFAFLGLVLVGGVLIARGSLEAGVLLAALFVVGQVLVALVQMGDLAGRAAEAATAGRRMGAYWDAEPAAARPVTAADARVGAVDAAGVSFGYLPDEPVFADVSLRVERGRIAALTAETGAGKSTFAQVFTGLLSPQTGAVRAQLDGGDASEVAALAPGDVLYLGPKPILVTGSIRDNLLLDAAAGGRGDADELDVIKHALRRKGEPLDWDAPLVDAGGGGLSSGQGQLVQLARAVARDPAVVVFDEATSSLDMETERVVQGALTDWCRGRVCLVISHRGCPWLDAAEERVRW